MSSGINEGVANLLAVKAESTFGGSTTGTAYELPAKIQFDYEPVLLNVTDSANVWRQKDASGYAGRFWQGSITLEYSHSEALMLLLASLIGRTGTSPNYLFKASNRSARQSLALSLTYQPNGLDYLFRGVVIESAQMTWRPRETARVRLAFKAQQMTSESSTPFTGTTYDNRAVSGLEVTAEIGGVALGRAYDVSLSISNQVELANFSDAGLPEAFKPVSGVGLSLELAEWMGESEADGDRIAALVRNQTETDAEFVLTVSAGKTLTCTVPRAVVREGTPPGFGVGGIGYRAVMEILTDEDRSDALTMVIAL